MISPFTAPGTKVVCIDDSPCPIWGLSPLTKDAVYTIERWDTETYVELIEFPAFSIGGRGTGRCQFSRVLFRRLDLPDTLTTILLPAPAPVRELEPA